MHTKLVRHDLLQLEDRLTESLGRVIPFTAHAVYFPQENAVQKPVWIAEEGRLLLPLYQNDELLGVFMARSEQRETVEALLPALPGLAGLCLDNLRLFKTGRLDKTTGLATREVLMEALDNAAQQIRDTVLDLDRDDKSEAGSNAVHGMGNLGLVLIRFTGLQNLVRETSHTFADALTGELAQALRGVLPQEALAARSGDYDFAVFVPGADKTLCANLAARAVRAMRETTALHPFSGRRVGVSPYAGFALFPQDMDGMRVQDMAEPAPILLHKAHLAAEMIRTRDARHERVMAYGNVLREGGEISALLPLSRVQITVGRSVGARDGQRFSVWSAHEQHGENGTSQLEPLYKGEIVLLETREHEAVGEILHLGDPAWMLEPDDTLLLLPDDHASLSRPVSGNPESSPAQLTDPITGLWRHGEFLARLAREREGCKHFTLALVHVGSTEPGSDALPRNAQHMEQTMAQVAELCREHMHSHNLHHVLGGRFALNSLIFLHHEAETDALTALYSAISEIVISRFGNGGIGLAAWPFMDFHPADSLECCRKALEYGLLLPAPHVGWFDSLAINISADKLHCRGDVFGAMEEYKLALLADPDNALAWNSLGVCMASLGHHAEARRHFEEALRRTPNDPAMEYNAGAVCQNLGDMESATRHFTACLALAPEHAYALIRLGQLAEARHDMDTARKHFEQASQNNPESALPQRHLARLALAQEQTGKAREHLHEALLRNPRDAAALTLMAKLYLDGDEDPEIAETLARQSVALRPMHKGGWLQLARALEKQQRSKEAREALLHAGAL